MICTLLENHLYTLFALLIIFSIALRAIHTVPESQEWTVACFGQFIRVLPPGLHLTIPCVDSVSQKISLCDRVLDIPPQAGEYVGKEQGRSKVGDGKITARWDKR